MRILVTGVYGFIGSHFARRALFYGHTVVGFSRPTDIRNFRRIDDFRSSPNFSMIHGDLTGDISGLLERIDVVVNFAAKTHVDHSIKDPRPFIHNNLIGTYNLLEQARLYKPKLYIQVSTDEVYGAIMHGAYKEDSRLNPSNPYSATKAGSDMLVMSYHNTYGLPTIITRTENNYGGWQHPQKAIPTFVRKCLANEPIPVYGDGQHKRMWLHVDDHCWAIMSLIECGTPGEIYHVAGEVELANIDLAKMIKRMTNSSSSIELIDDHDIRPGHDRRYALDSSKIKAIGWGPTHTLEGGMADAVQWYKNNEWWFA